MRTGVLQRARGIAQGQVLKNRGTPYRNTYIYRLESHTMSFVTMEGHGALDLGHRVSQSGTFDSGAQGHRGITQCRKYMDRSTTQRCYSRGPQRPLRRYSNHKSTSGPQSGTCNKSGHRKHMILILKQICSFVNNSHNLS
jgi:hypothetical protein